MGLARRAARKLVPVVLTLGSGPSGFPRNLSGRRPKLPRQPRRGCVARARSRNFDAGSWPVGLLETTFRATAEASATAMANPRRRTRARSVILALGAGPSGFPKQFSGRRPKLLRQPPSRSLPSFWRWGLARRASRNKFPSDAKRGDLGRRQPWQTRAVARARSVIRRCGLARRASGNNLPGEASATAMANPRRRTRALRYFGAGGWPVGLPETIFRATAKASATASLALASVVVALGVGPTGFPKQVSERCKAGGSWTPTAMANPRRRTRALRYFGAGGWPVGLPETIFRAKLPRQPWQTRAVARACSVILALGAGPSGFPKQVSERRKAGGSWRSPRHMRPEAYVATRAAQIFKGEGQASGRNGRFITNGQISSFGLRMADFILSRIRSLSAARIKFYQQYQGRGPGSGRNGRFIKQKRPNCQIS